MARFDKTLPLSRYCSVVRKGTQIRCFADTCAEKSRLYKAAQNAVRGSHIIMHVRPRHHAREQVIRCALVRVEASD